MNILGLTFDDTDASAALLIDGIPVAAIQEERLSRISHDPSLPKNAIDYCLKQGGLSAGDIDAVAFFGNPLVRFDRILRGRLRILKRHGGSFRATLKGWLGDRLFEVRSRIAETLEVDERLVSYAPRPDALAAASFQTSPFERACVIVVDGPRNDMRMSVFKGADDGLKNIAVGHPGRDFAEQVLRTAERTEAAGICLAGKAFRDPEVVGRIVREARMPVYLPTAPGNAGGAIGAALWRRRDSSGKPASRLPVPTPPARTLDNDDIGKAVKQSGMAIEARHDGARELAGAVAGCLAGGKAIGWFQGPAPWSEIAPNARCALIDPSMPEAARTLAEKLKWNDAPRRLALSVTLETAHEVFDIASPGWAERHALAAHPLHAGQLKGLECGRAMRCHAVDRKDDPLFHALLIAFRERTGLPALLNAPLALGKEPLAETPADALRSYIYGGLDGLALGDMMVGRKLTL